MASRVRRFDRKEIALGELWSLTVLDEQKNGTHKQFRALKVTNTCQQMLQNNFDHCNSGCQSINLTSIFGSLRNFVTSKV